MEVSFCELAHSSSFVSHIHLYISYILEIHVYAFMVFAWFVCLSIPKLVHSITLELFEVFRNKLSQMLTIITITDSVSSTTLWNAVGEFIVFRGLIVLRKCSVDWLSFESVPWIDCPSKVFRGMIVLRKCSVDWLSFEVFRGLIVLQECYVDWLSFESVPWIDCPSKVFRGLSVLRKWD